MKQKLIRRKSEFCLYEKSDLNYHKICLDDSIYDIS